MTYGCSVPSLCRIPSLAAPRGQPLRGVWCTRTAPLPSAGLARRTPAQWTSCLLVTFINRSRTFYFNYKDTVRFTTEAGKRLFFLPPHPDRVWGSPNPYSEYRMLFFPEVKQLTTHHCLMPRLIKPGAIPPLHHSSSWSHAELRTGK
jgi:hypothetical protein